MDLLLLIFTVVNIKVVLTCPPWVFPLDIQGGCCVQKEWKNETYIFITQNDKYEEFHCSDNCVYYKLGDVDSTDQYCFKQGGDHTPECLPFKPCNESSAEELLQQYHQSLRRFDFDLTEMDILVKNLKGEGKRNSLNNFLEYMYQFAIDPLTRPQTKILLDAPPCSDAKIKCDLCFKAMLESLVDCYEYGTENKTETGGMCLADNARPSINKSCEACLCEIMTTCDSEFTCATGGSKKNEEEGHHCDRNCLPNEEPKTCVFNFTLESLSSDTDGCRADGRNRTVLAYNKQIPGPTIAICEGDRLVVHLKNDLSEPTTLHFHGIRENYRPWSDGVPHVTQCPIEPNGNFTYGFNASNYFGAVVGTFTQAGTYWYHSHVGDQRTNGAYGALIIRPKNVTTCFELFSTPICLPYNVDKIADTIILQEWYENSTYKNLRSLLINGNGRVGTDDFTTDYTVFNITEPGKIYLYRVIGAISEDVPLRLSIDEHTFTAIAADSQNIEHVTDLTHLWVAGGERFHIVVQTKTEYSKESAYKIRVFGYGDHGNKSDPFCTIAWLKYPNQTVNSSFVTDADCSGFDLPSFHRTLNPVPNNHYDWKHRLKYGQWNDTSTPGNIFITDLRSNASKLSVTFFGLSRNDSEAGLNNTQYLELIGRAFNNRTLKNPKVPFLLQNDDYVKNHAAERCGVDCKVHVNPSTYLVNAKKNQYVNTTCSKIPDQCTAEDVKNNNCSCQHVTKQPYAPGYWVDLLLINNKVNGTAHPIHLHGGWAWVMAMDQYHHDINATFIKIRNENCSTRDHCLWKNTVHPIAKDTIQVPTGGYVLLRVPLDNKGTWLLHCHINRHILAGMAMVLQIGGLEYNKHLNQDWCTGPLHINKTCSQN